MRRFFELLVAVIIYIELSDFLEAEGMVGESSWIELYFIIFLVILIHEIGHILMMKITGVEVSRLRIGFGPKVFHYKGLELHLIPFNGAVWPKAGSKISRLKNICILIAGSLLELLVACFLIIFSKFIFFNELIYEFVIALICTAIINLLPIEKGSDGSKLFNIANYHIMSKNKIEDDVIHQDV